VSIAVLGFGSSITFQSGFFANVTDISLSGITRESVDVTNFASTNGWKEYMPSLMQDMGELEVELIRQSGRDAQTSPGESPTSTMLQPSMMGSLSSRARSTRVASALPGLSQTSSGCSWAMSSSSSYP
jgi:hypothetical protein